MNIRASACVEPGWSLQHWRDAARRALAAGVAPEDMDWLTDDSPALLAAADVSTLAPVSARSDARVASQFLSLAECVLCHRDSGRHALLYRMLWRLTRAEPHLLKTATDPDTRLAMDLAKDVSRDCHKMKAFVRFRAVPGEDNHYIAWFQPDHHIVDRVAPFFARRFNGMRWAILTPERSVRWDGQQLQFGPGGQRSDAPAEDASESLWQLYYANIFNPARLNPRMLEKEMPRRYWHNLPEVQQLPVLLRDAGVRVRDMAEREAQAPRRKIAERTRTPVPDAAQPAADLAVALRECRRCTLWQDASQVIPGVGPTDAPVMLVGEQPGDMEDITGRAFVGPAGQLLDRILQELGVDRDTLYITNAVKHFHHRRVGKRRLHQTPKVEHINACRPWLQLEIQRVQPRSIITLGAVALRAVLGKSVALADVRGRTLTHAQQALYPTVHPSWVLRQDADRHAAAYALLRGDLESAFADSRDRGANPRPAAPERPAAVDS